MKIIAKLLKDLKNKPKKELNKFLVIFYIVGFFGFLLPFSRNFFIFLIPYALVLNIFLLLFFHSNENKRDYFVFCLIFILGFFAEVLGVNTGKIFGEYYYGKGLGLKIFETPLIIGFNWLFLSYCFFVLIAEIKIYSFLKIFIASVGMVVYDIILEFIAPEMDMWYWKNDTIPFKNFIAWFIFSIIFQVILELNKTKNTNKIAKVLILCQFIFFVGLFIFFKIIAK